MDSVRVSPSTDQKPVIVRVKRKLEQSPLDAFWLETNEIPFGGRNKVLMQHLETVTDSKSTIGIIRSFFDDHISGKAKLEDRKLAIKKERPNKAAESARFEQVRRVKKGNERILDYYCRFYDVIRVDGEERPEESAAMFMSCYLPLLREFVPSAAKEIEADHIHSSIPTEEEYVYDCYCCYGTVSEEMDVSSKNQFPLVQVQDGEEDCFCSGPDDESEYDSEDSNAEGYAMNEYPEGNVREMSETSDESQDEETLKTHVGRLLGDDEFDSYAADNGNGLIERDGEGRY